MAKAWGTEWVTGMNSTSNGPILRRSPSATGDAARCARAGRPPRCGCGPGRASAPSRRSGTTARAAGTERPPTWSSWPWVATHADDAVGVLAQVGEVGQDEVDAVHVGSGNISPQSMSRMLVARCSMHHAVAADLAQAAEEDDADRRQPSASGRPGARGTHQPPAATRLAVAPPARALVEARPASGPSAGRHCPTGRPRWRSIALVGIGFGASSPVSKAKLSSRRALTSRAPAMSPFSQQVEHLADGRAPVQWVATPIDADGADAPAAAASSRRRRCRPRSRRAPRRSSRGRLARVAGGVLDADDVGHLVGQAHEQRRVAILRPVRTGMS